MIFGGGINVTEYWKCGLSAPPGNSPEIALCVANDMVGGVSRCSKPAARKAVPENRRGK
jgi:hypothetical protein